VQRLTAKVDESYGQRQKMFESVKKLTFFVNLRKKMHARIARVHFFLYLCAIFMFAVRKHASFYHS